MISVIFKLYFLFRKSAIRDFEKLPKKKPINSQDLEIIIKKDPMTAAIEIIDSDLESALNERNMNGERQQLLWKVIAHICHDDVANQTRNKILTIVADSKLLTDHLLHFLVNLRVLENLNQIVGFLKNVTNSLEKIVQCLPSKASNIRVANTLLSDLTESLGKEGQTCREVEESIKGLNRQLEELEKDKERIQQAKRIGRNPPPNDFREQTVLPTVHELQVGHEPYLRQSITRGVYADSDHYFDVQFRLLKEDFVRPLRNGISEYLTFKKANPNRSIRLQDIHIYTDVQFKKYVIDKTGLFHQVSFNKLDHVRWKTSKRLMYGSLLILSNDDFQTFLFATVAKREADQLQNGLLTISLVNQEDASMLQEGTFVMAESTVFFEAYRPVLAGLQVMPASSLPLSKYILGHCNAVSEPLYLHGGSLENENTAARDVKGVTIDISPLLKGEREDTAQTTFIPVLQYSTWSNLKDVELDTSQLEAIQTALTKEISLIQGPPGTGKTYVGLKLVETLLKNRRILSRDGGHIKPILLVCCTNHALDQFLEGILQFHSSGIVRVGSRSKSELLQTNNLNHLASMYDNDNYEEWRDLLDEMEKTENKFRDIEQGLSLIQKYIVRDSVLESFLSEEHIQSFENSSSKSEFTSKTTEWLLSERQNDPDWIALESTPANQEQRPEHVDGNHGRDLNEMATSDLSKEFEDERSIIESGRMIDDDFDHGPSDSPNKTNRPDGNMTDQ